MNEGDYFMTDAQDNSAALPGVRISDTDREIVARQLQLAVDEGRLDLMEFDARLVTLYAARTQAELVAVTADLPDLAAAAPIELRTESGSRDKSGPWTVPSVITAECVSGRITIDCGRAFCPHREVTLHAKVDSGSIVLIVPNGWQVDLDQVRVDGGSVTSKVRLPRLPGAPLLRVDGHVRSGSIKAKYPRRSFWSWLSRRPH